MPPETLLDVRNLPPRERHPKIFSTWDAIAVGGTLRLVNDHDPKPLYYQFKAERPDEFEWNYLETGPERWAVEIKRTAPGKPEATIPVSNCRVELPILDAPAWAQSSPAQVVDVREDLRQGREPLAKIMAGAQQTRPGQTLLVRATFEPVPLYSVLGKQGFEHWTKRQADDDWQVYFRKP